LSDLGRELVGLPSKSTAVTLGLGGLAALAVHPADATLSERASRSIPLDELLEFGAVTGDGWMQGSAALATFAMGRATGSHSVQAIGADLLQAQIVAAIMTHGLKVTVGRRRPDGGRRSFPSGHSSGTFANATVLQRDLGWKVGLPAYGLATYVAASRLSENRHYASDVIFGAAVGLVAGRTVTVGHGRRAFEMAAVGVPGGVGVAFTHIQ
jgi:membrane-associated phospholipid phosphatase